MSDKNTKYLKFEYLGQVTKMN